MISAVQQGTRKICCRKADKLQLHERSQAAFVGGRRFDGFAGFLLRAEPLDAAGSIRRLAVPSGDARRRQAEKGEHYDQGGAAAHGSGKTPAEEEGFSFMMPIFALRFAARGPAAERKGRLVR